MIKLVAAGLDDVKVLASAWAIQPALRGEILNDDAGIAAVLGNAAKDMPSDAMGRVST